MHGGTIDPPTQGDTIPAKAFGCFDTAISGAGTSLDPLLDNVWKEWVWHKVLRSVLQDGTVRSLRASRSTGVVRNHAIMFIVVIDSIQALLNNWQKLKSFTTFPTWKSWHTLCQCCLKGPNTPLSRGWVRWVVLGGRGKIITPLCKGCQWPSSRSRSGRLLGHIVGTAS